VNLDERRDSEHCAPRIVQLYTGSSQLKSSSASAILTNVISDSALPPVHGSRPCS
jgi:hypothetical protein